MVVLTYGPTQDHQSYMPPILTVDTEDLPVLEAFGEEVWTEQLRGESKKAFTLAFTSVGKPVVGGPLFKDELTGNQAVDDAVAAIRSQTTRHWLVPPEEVFVLLSKGHPEEGTAGQKFPPMTIFGGVLMTLTSYAHSGSLNAAASLFAEGPDGVAQADLKIIKRLVNKIGDANLPYLRALSLHTVCESFEQFFRALDQSETVLQVQKLMQAISLFGALMHGWVVYLFPYRLGVGLHVPEIFEPSSHPSFNVPLRSREGQGLGAATFHVRSSKEREEMAKNMHLPESLQSKNDSLPHILRLNAAQSVSLTELAVAARAKVQELLPSNGAILFRGLPLSTFSEASDFIAALGYTMYPDPSGREKVADNLAHSSLAVPPSFNICPHQEHIVSQRPPTKLLLFAHKPSKVGGEMPLCKASDVWTSLPLKVREQLSKRGVRFLMVRTNANSSANNISASRTWQEHWQTQDVSTARRLAAEQFPGVVTVDEHQTIYVRSPRLEAYKESEGITYYRTQLQNMYSLNWFWGDSDERINNEILEEIMGAVWSPCVVFKWQAGVVEHESAATLRCPCAPILEL